MIELAGTLATIIAVIGVVMNNHRKRACFIVWLVSNSIALAIHLDANILSLAVRDLIFLGLAVDGWWRWSKET